MLDHVLEKYIQNSFATLMSKLEKLGMTLPTKCIIPMKSGYHPSEDTTVELSTEMMTYYQELIGILRWAVEIGRVDILLEVLLLSSHLALPRKGHFEQVLHIFGYLKASPRKRLFFDPAYPKISEG